MEQEEAGAERASSSWKWESLVWPHGPYFPPPYSPHGVKLLYNGEPVDLNAEQEEYATLYASVLLAMGQPSAAFSANFFADWRELLRSTPETYSRISQFHLCDFSRICALLQRRREQKALERADAKVKLSERQQREQIRQKHGYVVINGEVTQVANPMVEPPGLFHGRGQHPNAGRIKRRILPEDITFNLSPDATLPPLPEEYADHKWGGVVHDRSAVWLARWRDALTGIWKFIFPAASAPIFNFRKKEKYDHAKQLNERLHSIRETYMEDLRSSDPRLRQRATALWFIDHAALRIGSKKDADLDTVGCCSLLVKHVQCDPTTSKVVFDFLGKDSIRYHASIEVPPIISEIMGDIVRDKQPSDMLFDHVNPAYMNSYLKQLMPNLTSIVMRRCRASACLQQQLEMVEPADATDAAKIAAFNQAFRNTLHALSPMYSSVLMSNYCDPRIIVSWCKRNSVPIEKILSTSLREKHGWAMSVEPTFQF